MSQDVAIKKSANFADLAGTGDCKTRRSFRHKSGACAILFALVAMAGCGGKAATPTAGPPDVSVTKVEQRDVPIISEWVATLDGFVNAQIQPQVTGYIIKQNYREGSPVRKGDILFEIDPRPFQALLDQAKAQLAQSEAQMGKTQLDVDRDTPLAKERAIAQSQLDNDIQANLAAKAAVQSAKAQVEQAALNLGFTHVTSLFDGIAGIAQIQLGNLVNPSTVLTSVSQVNPIKAYFPISEQEYLRLAEHINSTNRTEPAKDAPTASRGHAIRAATGSRIRDAFQRISLGAD